MRNNNIPVIPGSIKNIENINYAIKFARRIDTRSLLKLHLVEAEEE